MLRGIINQDFELRLRRAVEDYGCENIIPDFSLVDPSGRLYEIFLCFKEEIDDEREKRETISQKRSAAGKKGGTLSKIRNTRKVQTIES